MDILKVLFFLIITLSFPVRMYSLPDEELHLLDHAVKDSPKYMAKKIQRIDSLRRQIRSLPSSNLSGRLDLMIRISEDFRQFNTDSAFSYAMGATTLLQQSGVENLSNFTDYDIKCKLALMNSLSTAGIFSAATTSFRQLKQMEPHMSLEQKLKFWRGARQMYSYMKMYVVQNSKYYEEYNRSFIAYDDSLLRSLPHNDILYKYLSAEKLVRDERYKEAEERLIDILTYVAQSDNIYGMTAFQLAQVYGQRGNVDEYATYLAKASVSDIQGCVREGLALPALAQWLYSQGATNEAFKYMNYALSEANAGNARMRTVAIASYMPMIDSAYREKISSSNKSLMVSFIIVMVLTIATIVLVILLFRYLRHSRLINEKLRATSKIQENYIGHFISLCASYATKLDSLTHLVSRKISSGQSDELLKLVKSGKFGDQQNDDFYAIFDKAFLEIFPDFIEEINGLLQEEKRIDTDKNILTPELRIYALVRLGISESTRIAQILHYSVSTVYTYRNRMRNRAIERDCFEENVLKIGRHIVDLKEDTQKFPFLN